MMTYDGLNTNTEIQVHNCRRSRRPLNSLLGCCRSLHIFKDDDEDIYDDDDYKGDNYVDCLNKKSRSDFSLE